MMGHRFFRVEVKSDDSRSHRRCLILRHLMDVLLRTPQRHSAWQRRDRVTFDMSLFGSPNMEDTEGRDHGWRQQWRLESKSRSTPTPL